MQAYFIKKALRCLEMGSASPPRKPLMRLCENEISNRLSTMSDVDATPPESSLSIELAPVVRKRPKPGERRVQILQALATMLQQPGTERITTAALAARLDVSEAALYRHFASKAQMFEGLIEFIEQSVFSLVNQIADKAHLVPAQIDGTDVRPGDGRGLRQAAHIALMLMQFAEKNPGMARVMVGDALVFENERLQQRMNQFFDKIENAFKHSLRGDVVDQGGSATPSLDAQVRASVLTAFVVGRLQRFARSGFKRLPSEHLDASLRLIL
jgi:TetR/AcrR family transcriptional regulator